MGKDKKLKNVDCIGVINIKSLQPYCCPVCNGRGTVPSGFYNPSGMGTTSITYSDPCRSCTNGIIWG